MKCIKIVVTTLTFFVADLINPHIVLANGVCGLLPCDVASPCLGASCEGNSLTVVGTVLQFLLSFIFVGIIVYGIWLIIQAALKIIRSNGDTAQIQEGSNILKGVYIGIIMIFVGLLALVLVFVFFNATDIFKVNPENPPGINLS